MIDGVALGFILTIGYILVGLIWGALTAYYLDYGAMAILIVILWPFFGPLLGLIELLDYISRLGRKRNRK